MRRGGVVKVPSIALVVVVSLAHAVLATPGAPDGRTLAVETPLLDISGGGVGLLIPPEQAEYFQRGTIIDDCKVVLPDEGVLTATLCVRNLIDVTTRNGIRHFRVGCEFVNLSAARASLVQRYITRIERDRRARLSGN